MTWTWVSVGSGKASTVRSRKESQPQTATIAVRARTAALFFSEKSTSAWNTCSLLQRELVEEEDGALADVAGTGLEAGAKLDLAAALAAGRDGDSLQLSLAARDEHHRALAVGDHGLGRHADALLRRVGLQLDVDESVGAQGAILVDRADAQLDRAPLGVDHLRDAVDGPRSGHSAGAGADGHLSTDPKVVGVALLDVGEDQHLGQLGDAYQRVVTRRLHLLARHHVEVHDRAGSGSDHPEEVVSLGGDPQRRALRGRGPGGQLRLVEVGLGGQGVLLGRSTDPNQLAGAGGDPALHLDVGARRGHLPFEIR